MKLALTNVLINIILHFTGTGGKLITDIDDQGLLMNSQRRFQFPRKFRAILPCIECQHYPEHESFDRDEVRIHSIKDIGMEMYERHK